MPTPVFVRTLRAKKEQSLLYFDPDTSNRGNGNDKHMPLGKNSADSIFRGLLKFSLDWSDVYQIRRAVLVVKASGEEHVSFGTGPTIAVERCSEQWSQAGGSEGNWTQPTATNAVYPGPSVTGSAATGGPWGTATNIRRRIDITSIVEAWAPASVLKSGGGPGGANANHGIRLKAPNETTTADLYELRGSRAATVGARPFIELTYISNTPPNAATVTSPEEGDPAIVSSADADRLPVEFLFSDPDVANTCRRAALEVYGDAATDATPGTRIAGRIAAPDALGPLNAYRVALDTSHEDAGQTLSPRTNMRYRISTQDSDYSWGPWSPLAEGRIYLAYTVDAPAQLYMDPTVDSPHIFGSIVSNDPDDYIRGVGLEFYRDTDAGAVLLDSVEVGLGGTSTRSDTTYSGESLKDGETVRWRMRHANRDDVWGAWSPWQYTKVYSATGPNAMTPISPSTKLLTRTPDLTIGHSANFDGYRWRLYRDGVAIYDSGETAVSSTTSEVVTVGADLLTWGDGSDAEVPFEWDAQIRLAGSGVYGDFSPRYGLRVNALPGATLEVVTERTASLTVADSTPTLRTPYENVDQESFNEWPEARVLEIREATTTGGDLPAHDGTLEASQAQLDADTAITPEVDVASALTVDQAYEIRARFRDDATAIMTTNLAAAASATDTNIKVDSVTDIAVGDVIEIGGVGIAYEVRTVETVGTAGAGGTGLDLDDPLESAHLDNAAVANRYWGGWSNTEILTYHAAPSATPVSPADTATVNDPIELIDWTLSETQVSAIVRIYERVSGIDYLVWEGTVDDATTSWSPPVGLLDDGVTYAWDVTAYDAFGLSDTTTRRTFTTDFTPPAELTGLAAVTDASESSVELSWTASGDTYLDHYRVWWQAADGTWVRVDGGPDGPEDDAERLTATTFVHYGARFGENDYAVTASNGAQESDAAYLTATLDSVAEGWWMIVVPDESQYTDPVRVVRATRGHAPTVERFDPPGRGESVHQSWGRGPLSISLVIQGRPSEDGDLSSRFERIEDGDLDVWVKAPSGWQWEPVYARLTSWSEQPQTGGMLSVSAVFERTDET
jgi:hypothetical protein